MNFITTLTIPIYVEHAFEFRTKHLRRLLTLADVGVAKVPAGLLEVVGQAVLAVPPLGVVLAVLTDPS